ncbi:MAG: tRNA threonylcarbamoyladenosine biosynthesis protein TsaB [Candidatus Saccharimonadales bacterium]|jgi:tRNA threonylcarbamoyladenosine biosynthesis protein TsaB
MILVIRTDSPDSFIGLYENGIGIVHKKEWTAGRELSMQLNSAIKELCEQAEVKLKDVDAVIVYRGPGSYTGLRIGVSVANAIAYSYGIPISTGSGDNWIEEGVKGLAGTTVFKPVSVEYGGEVHITKPRK